jgi:NADPH:quinone reductase-like Zn-dependent oxidoreductase
MRAVVLDAPGPPEALQIREPPVTEPRPGWVLIQVRAFGINRSELHTRLGLAEGVTFPRVPGIEAVGVVAAAPGGEVEMLQTAYGSLTRTHGVVCFTGMLSNEWTVPDFHPIGFILDDVSAGRLTVPVHRVYELDQIQTAHADMKAGTATGKLVVRVG